MANITNLQHGDSRKRAMTALYKKWNSMKNRCLNSKVKAYGWYGGRGITVCDAWLNYIPFKKWAMENGYSDDLQIDRIDNDQGYSPENCRWVTLTENCNNRRNSWKYEYRGESKTLANWARHLKIKVATLRTRIDQRGWSVEDAFSTPVNTAKRNGLAKCTSPKP